VDGQHTERALSVVAMRKFANYNIIVQIEEQCTQIAIIGNVTKVYGNNDVNITAVDFIHDKLYVDKANSIDGNFVNLYTRGYVDVKANVIYSVQKYSKYSKGMAFYTVSMNETMIHECDTAANTVIVIGVTDQPTHAYKCVTITNLVGMLIISPVGGCSFDDWFHCWKVGHVGG
jgi:hypothetical protein